MKANEILQALKLPKSKFNTAHCSKLANVYLFLKEIKKDIVIAKITGKDVEMFFGRETKDTQKVTVINEGTKVKANKITVLSESGEYSFALPVDNAFYFAVCDLLELPYEAAQVETIEPLYKIVTDPVIMDNIKKAAKFTGKDALRPVFSCICLDFNKDGLQVVATDAHKIYYSKAIEGEVKTKGFNSYIPVTHKPMQLLISPESIKELCKSKIDYIEPVYINVYSENKANINGIDVNLYTAYRYPDYKAVIPEYNTKMTFHRKDFMEFVKSVQQYANKSTNQVHFHLNGNIEMTAQDVDFEYESIAQMNYNFKDFGDSDIAFNGTFLRESLSIFKANEIDMFHNGLPTKPAIFTDGTDNVLLMPLMINY